MQKQPEKRKKIYWRITATVAFILVVITFTPLVISPGKTAPRLFCMPYTLWTSIFITIALVILTYIGGKVHLNDD